jgi:membrane carboxypeptidase/penicillin-binding protein PbpC
MNRQERVTSLAWQLRGLLWWTCLSLHLSEREQITLIVSRSYMGLGLRGFSAGSQAVFNRPLALLSLEEAATLVSVPHCANCFHKRRKGWDRRRDLLLSRLQAGP